jgi:hypothetical protein
MLVHDRLVQVHRATVEDAPGIAALHESATPEAVRQVRGHQDRSGTAAAAAESLWRNNLKLSSGDQRPWVAMLADLAVGFVSAGPSRDEDATPATGELYVTDFDFEHGDGAGARALLHHACADLRKLGFSECTLWVVARDQSMRDLMELDGWQLDTTKRWHRMSGIPLLELRFRTRLA